MAGGETVGVASIRVGVRANVSVGVDTEVGVDIEAGIEVGVDTTIGVGVSVEMGDGGTVGWAQAIRIVVPAMARIRMPIVNDAI